MLLSERGTYLLVISDKINPFQIQPQSTWLGPANWPSVSTYNGRYIDFGRSLANQTETVCLITKYKYLRTWYQILFSFSMPVNQMFTRASHKSQSKRDNYPKCSLSNLRRQLKAYLQRVNTCGRDNELFFPFSIPVNDISYRALWSLRENSLANAS